MVRNRLKVQRRRRVTSFSCVTETHRLESLNDEIGGAKNKESVSPSQALCLQLHGFDLKENLEHVGEQDGEHRHDGSIANRCRMMRGSSGLLAASHTASN
jgi:hypothetical protein